MKKRTRLVILAIMLVLTIGASLVACGPDTTCTEHVDSDANGKCDNCDTTVDPEGNGGGNTDGPVELVKGGAATFQIVSSGDTASLIGKPLNNFVKTLNDCITNGNVASVLESADAMDVEIILGAVATRGNDFNEDNANPYAYGYEGWSVQVKGNKILVLGGSSGAYKDALAYLEETIFGIDDTTVSVDNITMTSEQNKTEEQTEFDISVSIDGTDLKSFVFAVNDGDTYATEAINAVRTLLFKKTGVYLKTVKADNLAADQKTIWIETVELNGSRRTDEGARIYVKDGNLHVETEFPNKLGDIVYDYFINTIAESKKSTVTVKSNFESKPDVRNIYYSQFGAKGDGVTEDFFAIKDCHDYANKYGHTVNSDGPDKSYYIGNYLGSKSTITSAIIKTNTNWHGCTFIFDDMEVPANSGCYNSPIFHVQPDKKAEKYSSLKVPFSSISKGATNVGGWAPGKDCLILIENVNKRHFIRYGNNADSGQTQQEIILVHADGTIDPSTPLHWDFEKITSITVYDVSDTPIVISGGEGNQRATVRTKFNNAPSRYTYFWRNILIERSNVVLDNINHVIEGEIPETEGGTGAPYKGFVRVNNCHNVLVQDLMIHKLRGYHLETDPSNSMGSYEMGSSHSNNLTWKNVTQNVFYNADGGVSSQGLMGTGYCKNMTLEDCVVHSFDAHQGIYNVTLKNSIFEHINFIGDGDITLEDVTIYIDPKKYSINLRSDYGSWWRGDIYMKNFTLKYDPAKTTTAKNISLINAEWINHYFGYTCYLPQNIYMENVNVLGFSVTVDPKTGIRNEVITEVNTREIYLFSPSLYKFADVDISDPNASMEKFPNDMKKCTCETRPDSEFYNSKNNPSNIKKYFNDTDGDGQCNNTIKSPNGGSMRCAGFKEEPDYTKNINPYIGTKNITVINKDPSNPIQLIYPFTPQFKDLNVTVDGKIIIEDGKEKT